jgi:hypothetical protein
MSVNGCDELTPNTRRAAPHVDNRLLRYLGVHISEHSTPAAVSCCKVCTVGKACGNTCISRNKTCHVGQGCACDG